VITNVLCTSHNWSHLSLRELWVGSHAEDERAQQNGTEASNDSDGDEVDLDRVRSHSNAGTSAAHEPHGVHRCIWKHMGRMTEMLLVVQNSRSSTQSSSHANENSWKRRILLGKIDGSGCTISFLHLSAQMCCAEGGADGHAEEVRAQTQEASIEETARLFVRNLPYSATEAELAEAFGQHGQLSEVHIVLDK
jgi:hypothetical protein